MSILLPHDHEQCACVRVSPDVSLLSPDSSYLCYSSSTSARSPSDGCVHSRCCRRSPRLLTNGYYAVTDDSFLWDEDGNVSLTPCAASVSYKENVFRWEWADWSFAELTRSMVGLIVRTVVLSSKRTLLLPLLLSGYSGGGDVKWAVPWLAC